MKRFLGTVMLFTMTLGWWGFVYPELCLTPEECQEQAMISSDECQRRQMSAPQENERDETIRIKSRLYEYICEHKEAAYGQ